MKHGDGGEADALFAFSRRVALRISSRLEREGDSTCFTFRPGRHDPYNCSNSVIDGGACSDALAAFVMAAGERLPAEERETLTRASVLHAQTYLRYCIVDKGIPAQCAWAMTGAAQAHRLSGHEVLRYACEVGAERLSGIQRADGSVPYHPVEWGAEHPGASDASAFYQSRVHAFTAFALDTVLGPEEASRRDAGFAAGLDFLHGLQGPDGIKTAGVEAKPWYWRSAYEVASHPFDVAAFAAEWRRTRAPRAASALAASWRAWLAHLGHDGRPASHVPPPGAGSNTTRGYQCAFFWAAHASWMARSLPEIEEALAVDEESSREHECGVRHFDGVDLARLDTPRLTAWVRGGAAAGARVPRQPGGGAPARARSRDRQGPLQGDAVRAAAGVCLERRVRIVRAGPGMARRPRRAAFLALARPEPPPHRRGDRRRAGASARPADGGPRAGLERRQHRLRPPVAPGSDHERVDPLDRPARGSDRSAGRWRRGPRAPGDRRGAARAARRPPRSCSRRGPRGSGSRRRARARSRGTPRPCASVTRSADPHP